MTDFETAERASKGSLRETLRSLRAAFAGAYSLQPALFVVAAGAVVLALIEVIPLMRSNVLYAAVAATFFLILGCVLYAKKGVVEAMVTFALGMFTAFTVPWNRSYFIIFAIVTLLFVVIIILLSSIKLAAAIQSTMTMAANFYINQDYEHNLRKLSAVRTSSTFQGTLLPTDRADAILFFAQRKVPIELMTELIHNVDQICTVTRVNQVKIETMLYKMYQATDAQEDVATHLALLQNYLLEGPASTEELVDSFIHTAFFVQDKPMQFGEFLAILAEGIARGYNQERLYLYIEQAQSG
jgi:hypothetical protein